MLGFFKNGFSFQLFGLTDSVLRDFSSSCQLHRLPPPPTPQNPKEHWRTCWKRTMNLKNLNKNIGVLPKKMKVMRNSGRTTGTTTPKRTVSWSTCENNCPNHDCSNSHCQHNRSFIHLCFKLSLKFPAYPGTFRKRPPCMFFILLAVPLPFVVNTTAGNTICLPWYWYTRRHLCQQQLKKVVKKMLYDVSMYVVFRAHRQATHSQHTCFTLYHIKTTEL